MVDLDDEDTSGPEHAARVAAAAITDAPVELLRRGDNHVFRAGGFVIRVSPSNVDATKQVAVAEVLLEAGIPVPQPAGAPRIVDGLPVTIWQHLPHDPKEVPDYHHVGAAIARLHQLPLSTFDGVAVLPWCGDARWLDVSTNLEILRDRGLLDAERAHVLRRVCERLADWPDRARHDGPLVICHGDLVPQNVLAGPNGPVILDWDYLCVGPPAWDHAALMTWADRWGGDPGLYPAFAAGYGADLSDSPIAADLAELRLLAPTINKILDGEHDASRAREGETRMRFWLGDVDPPPWTPQ